MIEYEQRRDAPVPEGDGVALALVGGPLSDSDAGLIELIERFGGRVALDGTEYGERTRPARFDPLLVQTDPMRALAGAYFSIPDAFRRPDTILHDWLARMTAERGIMGVILEHCLWCDLWRVQAARIRQCLDIPVLAVDLDGEGAAPRNSTRIQAFIESLT
jgi:benzoyl-CoA reductase/2-hydroxyglutaryl-CoA dehydratase subunit BcrC/BadD/HgdB